MYPDTGLLYSVAKRLVIEPFSVELTDDTLHHRGTDYLSVPNYIGEWMAITDAHDEDVAIGVRFDAVACAAVVDWFRSRQFENVTALGNDTFDVLMHDCAEISVPGWPFVPPEGFCSASGDFVFLIFGYYEE